MGVLAYTVASAAQGDRPWTRFNCRKGVGWGVGRGGESLGPGGGEAGLAAGQLLYWKVPSA